MGGRRVDERSTTYPLPPTTYHLPPTTYHLPSTTLFPIPNHGTISAADYYKRFERMAKQALARTTDLEPIDRLEEKIKLLVDMVSRLRADLMHAAEEHQKMSQEIDTLRARAADAEGVHTELIELRDERDMIRSRVAEMLEQLEAL